MSGPSHPLSVLRSAVRLPAPASGVGCSTVRCSPRLAAVTLADTFCPVNLPIAAVAMLLVGCFLRVKTPETTWKKKLAQMDYAYVHSPSCGSTRLTQVPSQECHLCRWIHFNHPRTHLGRRSILVGFSASPHSSHPRPCGDGSVHFRREDLGQASDGSLRHSHPQHVFDWVLHHVPSWSPRDGCRCVLLASFSLRSLTGSSFAVYYLPVYFQSALGDSPIQSGVDLFSICL